MVTGQKVSTLRNTAVVANLDRRKAIHPSIFTDPGIVSDLKVPWVFDIDGGLEHNSFSYLRTKKTQKKNLQFRRWIQRALQKNGIDKKPEDADQKTTTGVVPGIIEF